MNSTEDFDSLLLTASLGEPTWGFWKAEDDDSDDECKYKLDCDGCTPCDRSVKSCETVVLATRLADRSHVVEGFRNTHNPVSQGDTDTDKPDLPRNNLSSVALLTQFGLVHWNRGRVDAFE